MDVVLLETRLGERSMDRSLDVLKDIGIRVVFLQWVSPVASWRFGENISRRWSLPICSQLICVVIDI